MKGAMLLHCIYFGLNKNNNNSKGVPMSQFKVYLSTETRYMEP